MVRRIKPATVTQREHLVALHLDVYGYLTDTTAEEIKTISNVRCMQETARLMRAKADKDALTRCRAELKALHCLLFGRDREKLADIDTYSDVRCYSEIATLRRMARTQAQDRARDTLARAQQRAHRG